jgi:hypothetical protein
VRDVVSESPDRASAFPAPVAANDAPVALAPPTAGATDVGIERTGSAACLPAGAEWGAVTEFGSAAASPCVPSEGFTMELAISGIATSELLAAALAAPGLAPSELVPSGPVATAVCDGSAAVGAAG